MLTARVQELEEVLDNYSSALVENKEVVMVCMSMLLFELLVGQSDYLRLWYVKVKLDCKMF